MPKPWFPHAIALLLFSLPMAVAETGEQDSELGKNEVTATRIVEAPAYRKRPGFEAKSTVFVEIKLRRISQGVWVSFSEGPTADSVNHRIGLRGPVAEVVALKPVLEKALKWEELAQQNGMPFFNKVIGTFEGKPVHFTYDDRTKSAQLFFTSEKVLYTHEIPTLLAILPEVPKVQSDLNEKAAKFLKDLQLFN